MASEAYLTIYPYPLINPTITGNGYTLTPSVGNNCYIFEGIPRGTWTVLADGYNSSTVTVTGTSYTDSYSVTLTAAAQNISKLSIDGSTYEIKDATARTSISNLATVATSGSYNDLSNKPTIPTVNNPTITFAQGGTTKGTITLNQASNQTINFDAGGGSSYTAGDGIDITNGVISVDSVQTNELSIDTTPTQNSSNLITSGGVYNVLGDIETLINAL